MKVIVVNDFGHVQGGASDVAISSAVGLANIGVEVVFFTATRPIDSRLEIANIQVVVTGQVEILRDANKLNAAFRGMWNAAATKMFNRLLKNFHHDSTVIHVHGWTKSLSSRPIVMAAKKGYHVVVTLHDYFISCPNGCFYNHSSRTICKEKPLSLRCITTNCDSRSYPYKMYRVVRQTVQNKILRLPEAVKNYIMISDFSRRILAPLLPGGVSIYHVKNPIDVVQKTPANPAEQQSFLYCGRLSSEKGIDVLIEAFKDSNAQLLVAGEGEAVIPDNMKNVKKVNWLSKEQVIESFYNCRALIFPSVWYEVAPLTVQEAAAHGIPSIVADTCAAKDSVVNNKTGLHFKGGDWVDLRNKIEVLRRSDELVRSLGVNAYEHYWSQHTSKVKHAEMLVEVYGQILENRNSRIA